MEAIHTPLILYIPGLLPKPEPGSHKDALFRCLLEGVRSVDAETAQAIAASDHSFDIVSWTYDFYREHRDIALDMAAIEAVIANPEANAADRSEASSWKRRATRWVYELGDRLPFLIPHLANEKMEVHLRDLRRYTRNRNGIAEHTREMLKVALRAASEAHRPLLLIAHSMGSVIAFDSLWQMSHAHRDHFDLDLFISMGSPLGQSYLQRRMLGSDNSGAQRYPKNLRRWVNLSAVGDLTAVDPYLRNDFAAMLELGLVESIDDRALFNSYRLDGELNVHSEYGYLANSVAGEIVCEWWQANAGATTRDRA
jgi:hypothetical protein